MIGALGSVTKKCEKWFEKLQVHANIGVVQKATLLGTACILRRKDLEQYDKLRSNLLPLVICLARE